MRNDVNIYNEVIEAYNISDINNLTDGEIYNKIIKTITENFTIQHYV